MDSDLQDPNRFKAVGVPEYSLDERTASGKPKKILHFALVESTRFVASWGVMAKVWFPDTGKESEVNWSDCRAWPKKHKK